MTRVVATVGFGATLLLAALMLAIAFCRGIFCGVSAAADCFGRGVILVPQLKGVQTPRAVGGTREVTCFAAARLREGGSG